MAQYHELRPTNATGSAIVLELDTYLDTSEYDLLNNYATEGRQLFIDTWMAIGASISADQMLYSYLKWSEIDNEQFGFVWSIDDISMTENAYYESDKWKSFEAGNAIQIGTSGQNDIAMQVMVDTSISGADEDVTWASRLTLLTNGKLEIAGAFGGYGMHVNSSTGAGIELDRGATSNFYGVYFETNDTVEWHIGNDGDSTGHLYIMDGLTGVNVVTIEDASPVNSLFITTDGVGFGTDNPGSTIEAASTGTAEIRIHSDIDNNSGDTNANLRFQIDATTDKGLLSYDQGSDIMHLRYAGSTGIVLDSSNRVGIGDIPTALFDVIGTAAIDGSAPVAIQIRDLRATSGWTPYATFASLDFYSTDSSGDGAGIKASMGAYVTSATGANVGLSWSTETGAVGLTEKMWLTHLGDLGLGTDQPGDNIGGSSDLGGISLHVKNASGVARIIVEGSGGGDLLLVDAGGAADDKILNLEVDDGVAVFRSITDVLATRIDNILVMDLGTGNIGMGTSTLHANGLLTLYGTQASATAGPHVQFVTAEDAYPNMGFFAFQHDNAALMFDSYYDGAWKSSDAGSNFMIYKNVDKLSFKFDTGIGQGGGVVWNDGITLVASSGYVGFYEVSPDEHLHITDGNDPAIKLEKTGTGAGSATMRYNSTDASIDFIIE